MTKGKKYKIKCYGRSVEISKANSSTLIYRIPYQNLNGKEELFTIDNPFIVYILFGKNDSGNDVIYVGKSKNGLKNRPTSHEDKYDSWTYCYVLTQFKERTFFNDGAIQYLEDTLNKLILELGSYVNTTKQTTAGTANRSDEEDCDEYLEEAYQMLDVLGLDLITHIGDDSDADSLAFSDSQSIGVIPNGIYSMQRKMKKLGGKTLHAKMQVSDGKYIVLEGSDICSIEGPGLMDYVLIKRRNANIVNDKLVEDVILDSPSAAGSFVIGAACNGWQYWKCEDGSLIDKFRTKEI